MEQMRTITGNDLEALRSVAEPDDVLKNTMFALLWFIGETNPTWETVIK